MVIDAYESSLLLRKLKKRKIAHKPLRIAFLDIDLTMTGSHTTTNTTRSKLEQLGYAIVYVTARTEEMLMSSISYKLSKIYGFSRPQPHLGIYNGKRVYVPPEGVEPGGILDADLIAGSTGTQILVRQKNGAYLSDQAFESRFIESSPAWRGRMMSLIREFNSPAKRAFPALYEDPINYTFGISDVYQPKYRIALSFHTVRQKTAFRAFIRQKQKEHTEFWNILLTDDSMPKKDHYVVYLTPRHGSKTKAVDHIIKTITGQEGIQRSDLHVLIAGDGHADFHMGIKAARGTHVTFILAGGSRLMPALTCKDARSNILGKDLSKLKSYMSALKIKGYYRNHLYADHKVIICDEVYKGKKEVQSIFSFIEQLELDSPVN